MKNATWNGMPIPLELDHINGINTDHRLENLQILCPNCHAQTSNYRGRNKLSALSEKKGVEARKFGGTLTLEGDGNPERSPNNGERVETLHGQPKSCSYCNNTFMGRNKKYCSYECKRNAVNTKPKVPEILEHLTRLEVIYKLENTLTFQIMLFESGLSVMVLVIWLRESPAHKTNKCSENYSVKKIPRMWVRIPPILQLMAR